MVGSDDGEMSAVYRGDFVQPQTFGDRDNRGIDRA